MNTLDLFPLAIPGGSGAALRLGAMPGRADLIPRCGPIGPATPASDERLRARRARCRPVGDER
jgi:hypothetical protein